MDGNQTQCPDCSGSGCANCNNTGMVNAIPLGMTCEYGGCKRSGKDYKRPTFLAEKGWEDEPIYLCPAHAIELKLT